MKVRTNAKPGGHALNNNDSLASLSALAAGRKVKTRTRVLISCLAVLAAAVNPAPAQDTFANFSANVRSGSPGFPFPTNFNATRLIALYDTNQNGFIDTAGKLSSNPFPVAFEVLGGTGSWIGSPKIMASPTSNLSVLAQEGRFCGDYLIYAEQLDPASNTTFFIWFAIQDPNLPPRAMPCANFQLDFGLGSYQGSFLNPTNHRHASGFGGREGLSRYGEWHSSLEWHTSLGSPGTVANPGHIFSISADPTAAYPAPLNGYIAAEVYATGFDPNGNPSPFTQINLNGIVIDVPVINETEWNGQFFYTTQYPIARSVEPSFAPPPTVSASLWSPAMAGGTTALSRDQYKSIKFADVNSDGKADLCFHDVTSSAGSQGIRCALSTGSGFAAPTLWTDAFDSSWSTNEAYWGTIQYGDLNGDGKMDTCGRGAAGIYCALSNGSSFGPASLWSAAFSDANGWASNPCYWKTIRLVDVNGDGKADLCGRGAAGIYCALSNGSSFGPVTLWAPQFSDANQWNSDPSYWSTIQFMELNGDGRADVCGRGGAGLYCATSNGSAFVNFGLWTTQFSDAAGWKLPQYYSTIRFGDIDSDGRADVCGRGTVGFYCGLSTGSSFTGTSNPQAPEFSDANGWSAVPDYSDVWLADVNGDGNADICGRGWDGIWCALSTTANGAISFQPAFVHVNNFGDNYGWGSSESYWGTVQPAAVVRHGISSFCGRGTSGIMCSQ